MILSSESYAEPVFHILEDGCYAAVLERFPYPTPTFIIKRLRTDGAPEWRVEIEYTIGFTDNMRNRADVVTFMIQAQMFVDTSSISIIRERVTRLLVHWAKMFPNGIPDKAF